MDYLIICVALLVGVVIGVLQHHKFVMSLAEHDLEENLHRTAMAEARVEEFNKILIKGSAERDPTTGIIRFYEFETGQFICQGTDVESLATAFTERYPGKIMSVVEADPELFAELGLQ